MKKTLSIISIAVIAVAAVLCSGCTHDDADNTITANYGVYCINGSYEDGTAYGRMYLYQNASSYNAVTGGMSGEFMRFEFTLPKGAGSIFGQKLKIVGSPEKPGTANCFSTGMHAEMGGWIDQGTISFDEGGGVSGKLKYSGKIYNIIFDGELKKVEKANG